MKILYVITSLKMGGAEAALFNFLRYSIKKYDTQHIVAYMHDGPFVQKIRDLGIPAYHVDGWLLSCDLGTYVKLSCLIQSLNPDILHTSLWAANILGRVLAHCFALPLISEIHGDCRYVSASWKNWLDAQTLSGTKNQKIIAVADGVYNAYLKTVIGAIKNSNTRKRVSNQLITIKNGIDVTGFRNAAIGNPLSRVDIGLQDSDFVIGSVGRLESIKSYDLLLRAFALVKTKEMKLCLVGDGSERRKLEALADSLQIRDAVIFVGQRTDVYRFYPLFDCFALSSQTEGLSLALLEALAFGLPVITTSQNKQYEVLVDGVNGLLVSVNDLYAYVAAIKKLYENAELCEHMHHANLKLIESFDLGLVVDQYQKLYRELCLKHN